MNIQSRLVLTLFIIFTLFSLGAWFYTKNLNQQLNEEWAQRFVQKQIIFDKYRTLIPIMREVALVKKMSQDPYILAMALNDEDAQTRKNGLKALEKYRLKFKDRSYFAAFTKSHNYYCNDFQNSYATKELCYKLSQTNKDDAWFFAVTEQENEYQINVNKDAILGTTKVWIDYLLKDANKTVGVIGTGLDLTDFLKESVDIKDQGIRNLFINKQMAIQLENDKTLIDYASITKKNAPQQTLDLVIKNPQDLDNIRRLMHELEVSTLHNDSRVLWITLNSEKILVGISYLKELDWFSITFIDSKELTLFHHLDMFFILTILFSFSLIIINYVYNKMIMQPINELKNKMCEVQNGVYNLDVGTIGSGEIATLSKQFQKLLGVIASHNEELEIKIHERTNLLRENEDKLNTILNSVEGYIYIKDTESKYTYVNKYVCELFQKPCDAIIGKDDSAFLEIQSAQAILENDKRVLEYGESVEVEETRLDVHGQRRVFLSIKTPLFREDGTVYALCGISTDVTERKNIEEMNRYLALYDALTNLPNRRLFYDRLLQAMSLSKRMNFYGAVMFLDLDNFKPLNDTYGHDIGDALLIEAAKRMKSLIRETDTAARFGGDEFVIILSRLDEKKENSLKSAMLLAQKIATELAKIYKLQLSPDTDKILEYSCSASIGLTLFKGESVSKETLLNQADQKMYEAKKLGKNQIAYFDHPDI